MSGAEAPAGARGALERASAALERGGSTDWRAPSAPRGTRRRGAARPAAQPAAARVSPARARRGDPRRGRRAGARPRGRWRRDRARGSARRRGRRAAENADRAARVRRDDVLVAPTIREHGIYGTEIGAFLKRRLRVGSTFVDVGANLGWFSVLAARLVGERGRVYAVEPDPANLPLLRANLWGNRCDNATVLGVAAWSGPAHLDLVTYPEGGAATEVRAGGDGTLLVPAAPLDSLIPGTVDVLKVDAQMTDHVAIRGAERIIATSPRIAVIAEFFPAALRDKSEDPERILD